ncbi:3-phosphoshikimate 1-carboxyvinyltransferase [Candidatus Planktophila versatilis]|uniref:3-phosphoshikimate 1-carboxyvinyltransferase n=1 Tax=Candidatus Planktophila versatilis TaxID=1884905 RepID=A0AAD0E6B7_9ACTN|nr:3-phosphoshikimate 1-carboxyvinyltransferase [Candidatus Planktophila versatilis]ASY16822.1 3-phosphoshikimate 1-carboxyvinyltransferase [Candidatus Planktophila versatilis]ASY22167.1 3-phosphoshikimate 1-carboxyvinyltransferase [Candidatus Planktophila versatilis]
MHELWPAPFRGRKPISSQVTIPGSKSVTNRALILAAQATSPSIIRKPLISRDSELMSAGLVSLGVGIHDQGDNQSWRITPAPLKGPALIDVGNAGTVMRFLPPLAALAQGEISFDGDSRSYERPIGPVIKALEELGIEIDHQGRYSLPMVIKGTGVIPGGKLTIDASKSSQFLSALLLVGPSMKKGITVTHNGSSLPSMPHIDMTVQMLRDFGAEVEVDKASQSWSVKAGYLTGQDLVIEPDLSNAAPFLSIAMVCGGSITIADWPKETTQPGDHLREIFTKMGARVELDASGLTLTGGDSIHGIDIDLHDVGELTPSIAALAALADSPSHLRGIGHLRLHETDRLAALTREINALGGSVVEEETALHITPAPLHGGTFHTYDDHRLATAGAVIGLVTPDVMIENVATTRKTLPDFPGLWKSLVL